MRAVICGTVMALTVTAAFSEPAGYADYSANRVLPGCRTLMALPGGSGDLFDAGMCVGELRAIGVLTPALGNKSCVPTEATYQQIARVVVTYIEARPNRMHEPFEWFALEALAAAWPCKDK